ncbi:hypothetical protein [Acinetobacter sp. PK01]|uniref:hypothetical protein n=1 Tax=Acinetobacter sp. PK01 TaxID=2930198 RepID=UPI001FB64979|nr:hypothetical protein [Acinetobacter sp. PK01]UOG19628.1 hypothetical protein MP622_03735 [Acinetobacter sp. PK01]
MVKRVIACRVGMVRSVQRGSNMKFNFSLDTAIIITLLTVLPFGVGQAYLGGLLRPFYIDPIVLNFSVQDKIYWGFLKGFNLFIWTTLVFIILFALRHIWSSLGVAAFLDKKIVQYLQRKLKIKHIDTLQPHNRSQQEEFEKSFSSIAVTMLLSIGLLIGYLYALSHFETKGKENGAKYLANVKVLPKVSANNSNQTLYLIQCGSALCALIDEKKNVSLVEPKNVVLLGSNFTDK